MQQSDRASDHCLILSFRIAYKFHKSRLFAIQLINVANWKLSCACVKGIHKLVE